MVADKGLVLGQPQQGTWAGREPEEMLLNRGPLIRLPRLSQANLRGVCGTGDMRVCAPACVVCVCALQDVHEKNFITPRGKRVIL